MFDATLDYRKARDDLKRAREARSKSRGKNQAQKLDLSNLMDEMDPRNNRWDNRVANSIQKNKKPYKNPFELENSPKLSQVLNSNPNPSDFDQKLEEMLKQGEALKKRMARCEGQDMSQITGSILEDMLEESFNKENSILKGNYKLDSLKKENFGSKEAELESLRLLIQDPSFGGFLKDSKLGSKLRKERLELKDVERLKIEILSFEPQNSLLSQNLEDKDIKLEVIVPRIEKLEQNLQFAPNKSPKTKILPGDKFIFNSRRKLHFREFNFNQTVDSACCPSESGIKSTSEAQIQFIIKSKISNQNSGNPFKNITKDNSKEKEQIICKGNFSIEKLIMAQDFCLEIQVELMTCDSPDVKKKIKMDRRNLRRLENVTPRAGILKIKARLYNENIEILQKENLMETSSRDPIRDRQLGQTTEEDLLRTSQTDLRGYLPQNRANFTFESRFKENPILPVFLFLHVKKSLRVRSSNQTGTPIPSNLYLEHKIYGTKDTVRSHVAWNKASPAFDHRISMPLNKKVLEMTRDIPMAVSVWNKASPDQEQLIGFTQVPLHDVFSLLGKMSFEEIKNFFEEKKNSLIEIACGFYPITSIALGEERGKLEIMLALGNMKQINLYDKEMPPINSSDRNQVLKTEEELKNSIVALENDPSLIKNPETGEVFKKTPNGGLMPLKRRVINSGSGQKIVFVSDGLLGEDAQVLKIINKQITQNTNNIENDGKSNQGNKNLILEEDSEEGKDENNDFIEMRIPETGQLIRLPKSALKKAIPVKKSKRNKKKKYHKVIHPQTGEIVKIAITNSSETSMVTSEEEPYQINRNKSEYTDMGYEDDVKIGRRPEPSKESSKQKGSKLKESQNMKIPSQSKSTLRRRDTYTFHGAGLSSKVSLRLPASRKSMMPTPKSIILEKYRSKEERPSHKEKFLSEGPKSKNSNSRSKKVSGFEQLAKLAENKSRTWDGEVPEEKLPSSIEKDRFGTNSSIENSAPEFHSHNLLNPNSEISPDRERSANNEYLPPKPTAKPRRSKTYQSRPSSILSQRSKQKKSSDWNLKNQEEQDFKEERTKLIISQENDQKGKKVDFENNINVGMILGDLEKYQKPNLKEENDFESLLHIPNQKNRPNSPHSQKSSHRYNNRPQNSQYSIEEDDAPEGEHERRLSGLEEAGELQERLSEMERGQEILQYDTLIAEEFASDDVLATYTFLLEYIRRFIYEHPALAKNLQGLLLGLYQPQMASEINFEYFEHLLIKFKANITKEEAKPFFTFLNQVLEAQAKEKPTGRFKSPKRSPRISPTDSISLKDIHNSFLRFYHYYDSLYLKFYQTFQTLLAALHSRSSLEDFAAYLDENSDSYHISNEYLKEYTEQLLKLNVTEIAPDLITCGDFLYYDCSYIFNLLNFLTFLQEQQQDIQNFQAINSLHNYYKFLPFIEEEIKEILVGAYGSDGIKSFNQKFDDMFSDMNKNEMNEFGVDVWQLREIFEEIGLDEISFWEILVIFYHLYNLGDISKETVKMGQYIKLEPLILYLNDLFVGKKPKPAFKSGKFKKSVMNVMKKLASSKKRPTKSPGRARNKSIRKNGNEIKENSPKKSEEGVKTGRKKFEFFIRVEEIEDLKLKSSCDYCDLTVSFKFPHEEDCLESQEFTYVPDEFGKNYIFYIYICFLHKIKI